MSLYHFEKKSGKRGSAIEHIRYMMRAGSHAGREDLLSSGYGNMPDWAQGRPDLFFRISDKNERLNGCPYRDLTISLPQLLTPEQNAVLADDLAWAMAGSKPFLYAVHLPISSLGQESNPHVHVMICDRVPDGIERSPERSFRRYNSADPRRGGWKKDSGGMTRQELSEKILMERKHVADMINEALELHGHTERVDHRSLHEQGEQREPERYLGPARIRGMSEEEKYAYLSARRERRNASRRGAANDSTSKPTFGERDPSTCISDEFIVFGPGGLSGRRHSNY